MPCYKSIYRKPRITENPSLSKIEEREEGGEGKQTCWVRSVMNISEVTKSHPKGDEDINFSRLISQMNRDN